MMMWTGTGYVQGAAPGYDQGYVEGGAPGYVQGGRELMLWLNRLRFPLSLALHALIIIIFMIINIIIIISLMVMILKHTYDNVAELIPVAWVTSDNKD